MSSDQVHDDDEVIPPPGNCQNCNRKLI